MPPTARTATIASREIPFEAGTLVTAEFDHSPYWNGNKGTWEFWTAYKGDLWITVRCRQDADPGERFMAMKTNLAEQAEWAFVSSEAQAIRPATMAEARAWVSIKPLDGPYLLSMSERPFVPG